MPAPTDNDRQVFYVLRSQKKVEQILYAYLYRYHNMEDAGRYVFPDQEPMTQTQYVSCVMRCYGFDGRNGGLVFDWNSNNHWEMDDKEAEQALSAFAEMFPNGLEWMSGERTLKEFLVEWVRRIQESEIKEITVSTDTSSEFEDETEEADVIPDSEMVQDGLGNYAGQVPPRISLDGFSGETVEVHPETFAGKVEEATTGFDRKGFFSSLVSLGEPGPGRAFRETAAEIISWRKPMKLLLKDVRWALAQDSKKNKERIKEEDENRKEEHYRRTGRQWHELHHDPAFDTPLERLVDKVLMVLGGILGGSLLGYIMLQMVVASWGLFGLFGRMILGIFMIMLNWKVFRRLRTWETNYIVYGFCAGSVVCAVMLQIALSVLCFLIAWFAASKMKSGGKYDKKSEGGFAGPDGQG